MGHFTDGKSASKTVLLVRCREDDGETTRPGLEPGIGGPKPPVLPLHHRVTSKKSQLFEEMTSCLGACEMGLHETIADSLITRKDNCSSCTARLTSTSLT